LYFFRKFETALSFTEDALRGDLLGEFRKTLEDYRARCEAKLSGRERVKIIGNENKST